MQSEVMVAVAQYAPDSESSAASRDRAVALAESAGNQGADIVLMPELMTTPYFPMERDPGRFAGAESIPGPTTDALAEVARHHSMYIVAPLFETTMPGVYFNSACLIDRTGALAGVYRKTHIPAVRSHEKWYFRPGSDLPVFSTDFGPIGILICQDRVFPEAARVMAVQGAVLLLITNALADYASGRAMWKPLHQTRAFENSVYVVGANRCGREGEHTFFGGSLICDPMGRVMAEAGETEELLTTKIHMGDLVKARSEHQVFRDLRPELYGPLASSSSLEQGGNRQ